jgi:hypothetical protein
MGTVENPKELQSIISQKNVEWVYRSCQDKLEMAHERALRHHNQFINFYGDDLKTFPNVKQLMSSEKKRLEAYNQQVAWANSEPGKEPKMKNFKFHNNMKKWKGSVAAFSDPVRGISYIPGFQYLHDGLTHSEDYTQEMWERFNQFMDDPTVPPSCVRRLTREFGLDSLLPHYQCRHQSKEMVQEFFLRCHKGKQFRKVFPNIAIV